MEISYVGSRTYNLDSSSNLNLAPPSYTDPCNLQLGTSHIPDKCNNDYRTNPFEGVAPFQGTGYYSASTLSGYTLETPYPAFGNVTEAVNDGRSWYNSLQVVAQYRQSNALTLHGTYTWSKQMNAGGFADQPHNIQLRTIDANDRTNMATISAVAVSRRRSTLAATRAQAALLKIQASGSAGGLPDFPHDGDTNELLYSLVRRLRHASCSRFRSSSSEEG